MKILVWNCRGLGSPRAVRALLDIQKREKPDVLFLSETHLDNAKAEKVRKKLGYDQHVVHESDGRSGGLLMFWKDEVEVVCSAITENYIDVLIKEETEWRLTGIY